jgi:tripartite-type tricarboxylate transporter receptor subunit TctC
LSLAGAAIATTVAPRLAAAQTYPARPVRVIVPYAPGGPTDVTGRLVAQKLSEHFGKQFYVENIGGASGNIGMGRA